MILLMHLLEIDTAGVRIVFLACAKWTKFDFFEKHAKLGSSA